MVDNLTVENPATVLEMLCYAEVAMNRENKQNVELFEFLSTPSYFIPLLVSKHQE